jgi:hypothetical protein
MLGWLRRLSEWDKRRAFRAECRASNVCPDHMLPYRALGIPECQTCEDESIAKYRRARDKMQHDALVFLSYREIEQRKESAAVAQAKGEGRDGI